MFLYLVYCHLKSFLVSFLKEYFLKALYPFTNVPKSTSILLSDMFFGGLYSISFSILGGAFPGRIDDKP